MEHGYSHSIIHCFVHSFMEHGYMQSLFYTTRVQLSSTASLNYEEALIMIQVKERISGPFGHRFLYSTYKTLMTLRECTYCDMGEKYKPLCECASLR